MRTIKARHRAQRDDIQDLRTQRPLPNNTLDQLDPFLFLNHHGPQVYNSHNRGLPFGPHPHRGFETLTIILEGDIAHFDSAGHESVIGPGGIQWMTAGRGLIHSEVSSEAFKKDGGSLEILQLWINLPSSLKMTEPRYTGLQKDSIPSFSPSPGVTVNLFSGEFLGHTGALQSLTGISIMSLSLEANKKVTLPAPKEKTVFCYVVSGELKEGQTFELIEFKADGEEIELESTSETTLIYGLADPLNEPVVSYGPFVMNTKREIEEAIQDYQEGRLK